MSLGYKYFRANKKRLLERIKGFLDKDDNVLLAIIFGSFIELKNYRDIDMAVYLKKYDLDYILSLGAKLEFELEIPIDIVPLNEIDANFKKYILTKGQIIVEKVPGLFEALMNMTYDELFLINLSDNI